jgi:ribosomal protein S18 acetylase RimI-like enzyme
MKIIKETDLSHKIFINYKKEDDILERFRFESPEGYMIIRRSGEGFNIKLTAEDNFDVDDTLEKILKPYLKGDVIFNFDTHLQCLKTFIETKDMNYWYGMYEMNMARRKCSMTVGSIQPYNNEVDTYCRILGKCFEPMRERHDFKPYDWYEEKREEALKEFKEANAANSFYGYVVDGEIIGAAVAIKHEIDILGIEPKLHKKGYGRQLLRGVLEDMFKRYDTIEISVVESNQHVLKLYESEGFMINSHKQTYKNY